MGCTGDSKVSGENYILAELKVGEYNVDEEVAIISSYEESSKNMPDEKKDEEAEFKNEDEIKESTTISINDEVIPFSYRHKFPKQGIFKIKYTFSRLLTKTDYMFFYCGLYTKIDLTHFNTEKVTNMASMFYNCFNAEIIDVSKLKTKNVTDMSFMFTCCEAVKKLDLSKFDTRNVKNMSGMFNCTSGLTELDLSNFNTKNVTNLSSMFSGCNKLKKLNVSSFNTENVTKMYYMFSDCKELTNIKFQILILKMLLNYMVCSQTQV